MRDAALRAGAGRQSRLFIGALLAATLVVFSSACRDAGGSGNGTSDARQSGAERLSDFAREVSREIDPEDAKPFSDFVEVVDGSGVLRAEAPAEWSDVDGRSGPFGPDLRASSNLADYNSTYAVSGFQLTATTESTTASPEEVLDELAARTSQDCDEGTRERFAGRDRVGVAQVFVDCSGGDGGFVWVAVVPRDDSYVAVLGVQVLTSADVGALDRLLSTYEVDLA